jgi:hypothetical protein
MIRVVQFIPCATVLLDKGTNWLTLVHLLDTFQPPSYPYALGSMGLALVLERDLDGDPPRLDLTLRLRVNEETIFVSGPESLVRVDFGALRWARQAVNVGLSNCVLPRPGTLLVELLTDLPGAAILAQTRIEFIPLDVTPGAPRPVTRPPDHTLQ